MVNDFYLESVWSNPSWEVKLPLIPPPPSYLSFFSFSIQPRQMGINRKSRKRLENKLVVKCCRLNFYFKGHSSKRRGRGSHNSRKNFEARTLWMWSSKLRWKVRRMPAAQKEEKRSKTLQMNGTNKCSAVNTSWHLNGEAKPCWCTSFWAVCRTRSCQTTIWVFRGLFRQTRQLGLSKTFLSVSWRDSGVGCDYRQCRQSTWQGLIKWKGPIEQAFPWAISLI